MVGQYQRAARMGQALGVDHADAADPEPLDNPEKGPEAVMHQPLRAPPARAMARGPQGGKRDDYQRQHDAADPESRKAETGGGDTPGKADLLTHAAPATIARHRRAVLRFSRPRTRRQAP